MPSSLQAALIFLVLIVPGFLFVRGFARGRPRLAPSQPLYVLAQAVVASAALLAVGWWLSGRTIARWIDHHTAVTAHRDAVYFFVLAMLVLPFPLGLAAGGLAEWLLRALGDTADRLAAQQRTTPREHRRRRAAEAWLLRAIESRELLDHAATWDRTWRALQRQHAYLYVRVRTKSGNEVTGEVGNPDGPMAPVEGGRGIFVRGAEIETLEFRGPAATIPAGESETTANG